MSPHPPGGSARPCSFRIKFFGWDSKGGRENVIATTSREPRNPAKRRPIRACVVTGSVFHNAIDHFARHDVLDFSGLKFHPGATATYHPRSHALTVHSGLVTDTVKLFSPGGTHFVVAGDGHGGSKVTLQPPHHVAAVASLSPDDGSGQHSGGDGGGSGHAGWDFLFVT